MPTATRIFLAANSLSGAMPLRSRKLELQLWQMQTPCAATSSISSSESQTA